MNRFEQLIEYVINDEEAKARELFHDIVVEKSRQIYEDIMAEEEVIDEESTHDEDEKAEKAGRRVTKDIEYDDKRDRKEKVDEAEDEDIDEAMGGRAAPDLIDDVEMDEESDINMEGEDEEEEVEVDAEMDDDDHHADIGGEEELEDRVMDLEDKLDELMAEFEALMGDEGDGDMMGPDEGGDAIEMDDTEEMMPEMGMPMPMEEGVDLKAAPKPVTSEEGSVNKKSTVAANSGAKGAMADPVKMTGDTAQGRPAPTAKDMISDFQNKAGAGMKDQKPATKPHLAQATGVNVKSPLPSGTKG
jgi:hypothetical protein